MSQYTTTVTDGTGQQVLDRINQALETLNTLHAGAVAPSSAECRPDMLWADTANGLLKLNTTSGSQNFITLGGLTANLGLLPLSGGNLTGAIDFTSVSPATAATMVASGGNLLKPTGTTSVTALGSAQIGAYRHIRAETAFTLCDGTNLILPGSDNITTASGDIMTFVSVGSGIWQMSNYLRADGSWTLAGQLNERLGLTLPATTQVNLGDLIGNFTTIVNSSGASTISSLGTVKAGAMRTAVMDIRSGSVTFTHNASLLSLPGGNNLSVTDGDALMFRGTSTGYKCVSYQKNTTASTFWAYVSKNSTSYTLLAADYGAWFEWSASSAVTLNLLSAASAGAGYVFAVRNNNTNSAKITIDPAGSETVEGVTTLDLGVGSSIALISDGVNKWMRVDTGIAGTSLPAFTTGSQTFTGNGTFTVPPSTFFIRVTLWGAGGGGGGSGGCSASAGSSSGSGGGGGGGGFGWGIFAVSPAAQYTVTVGTGGAGGAGGASGGGAGTQGSTGNSTSFGALLSATGGVGGGGGGTGVSGAPSAGAGGAGGTASGAGTLITGGAGGDAYSSDSGNQTAGGGGSAGGVGGGSQPGGDGISTASGTGGNGSGGAAGGAAKTSTSAGADGTAATISTRESGGAGSGGFSSSAHTTTAGGSGTRSGAGGGGAAGANSTGQVFAGAIGGWGGDGAVHVEW